MKEIEGESKNIQFINNKLRNKYNMQYNMIKKGENFFESIGDNLKK